MRRLLVTAGVLLAFGFFHGKALACGCAAANVPGQATTETRAERKRYYQNDFKGYLFTGRVIDIKSSGPDRKGKMVNVVKVMIEKYWLRTTPKVMIVLTAGDAGDCGMQFKLGKKYVFKPQHRAYGLTASLCDYLGNGDADLEGETARELLEVLGQPVMWGCSPRLPGNCKNPSTVDQ